jgi:hypothetical protein
VSDAQGPGESGPQTQLPAPPPSSPPPPLPPTAAERGGVRALFLSIAGLLLPFLGLFLLDVVSLGLLIAGIVTGIQARRRARRILTRAPRAVAAIVVGLIGLFLTTSNLAVRVVAGPEFDAYAKCRVSALTISDKQACQDRYFPRIERKLHLPKGSMDRYRSMM